MVPSFVADWQGGLTRFVAANPNFTEFNALGRPVFAGWIFNGFDTARLRRTARQIRRGAPPQEREMIQADRTMHDRVARAIREDLVARLTTQVTGFPPVANGLNADFRIGDIEDANVLIQNSLWLHVPLGQLHEHQQVVTLQDRRQWAPNQLEQIELLRTKFAETAGIITRICV
jgi:hypothetical protein